MGNIAFKGTVNNQSQSGETVTLTVTKPDNTKDIFTATTLADKSYTSSPRPYVAGSGYSVVAHVDADADYKAADSLPFPFTVQLLDRTITVAVV